MAMASEVWRENFARHARVRLRAAVESTLEEAIAIQQIAAPTFQEKHRARYVQKRLEEIGVADVEMDDSWNVLGRWPGREDGPGLLITAHLDTIFPEDTELTVRREGNRVYGPGLGDNSMGVAGLLRLADLLGDLRPARDIWFAANVREEGLGNLGGMWAVMRHLEQRVASVIVLEGSAFGTIIHKGVGVQRRRITVETSGGHSWSDFGAPNAIHELSRLITAISNLVPPEIPRTTFNIGVIEGGTSINTIAAHASALLDLRSEAPNELKRLVQRVDEIVARAQRDGVRVSSEIVGERPAGWLEEAHPLVQAAIESLLFVGYDDPTLRAASTDANVPLSIGIPAICIGLTEGHNAHRPDEYIVVDTLSQGLEHALLSILAALELLP